MYELLTGRPAFRGDAISDTIAAILGREPDWTGLPEATPASIRRLLQRCLGKDSKRRLHIADARIELDDALSGASPSPVAAPIVCPAQGSRARRLVCSGRCGRPPSCRAGRACDAACEILSLLGAGGMGEVYRAVTS